MKKYIKILFPLLSGLLVILATSIMNVSDTKGKSLKDVTVIMRDTHGESWENLKEGAEQAASDLNANLRFVNFGDIRSVEEQIELLYNEVESGADAIVISTLDYKELNDAIQKVNQKIPVILIESTIDSKKAYGAITCDNRQIGIDLAEEVFLHGNTRGNILIIDGGFNFGSILDIKKGFYEEMSLTKNNCIEYSVIEPKATQIRAKIADENIDVIVALGSKLLETSVKAVGDYEEIFPSEKVEIYGMGNSSEVIFNLENNNIVSIVARNDFSMGYLGVKNAVNAAAGKEVKPNYNIKYSVVDQEHAYSIENQRILFPFAK